MSNNRNMSSKQARIRKKKKKKRIKIAILIIELIVVVLAVIGLVLFLMPNSKAFIAKNFLKCSLGQTIMKEKYKDEFEEKVQNKDVDKEKIEKVVDLGDGYTNIALFGIDPRNGEFDSLTHTDSIIIVSIKNKANSNGSHDIKMVSLYRDTLLRMTDPDGEVCYSKANAAFFKNGIEGALSMINTNLDMDITEYALVNFSGLATIIDALGGIDVTVTDDEVELINGYLIETREITGMTSEDVVIPENEEPDEETLEAEENGERLPHNHFVHLNGLQATAYCRIRYTEFYSEDGQILHSDYGRTARQRYVLNKILIHAKTAGLAEIMDCADEIFKKNNVNGQKIMETNMSWNRIEDLISVGVDSQLVGTQGFPYDEYTPEKGQAYYGYVIPVGLEQNVKRLHEYLFENKDYQPSEMVKKINDYIIDETDIEPEEYDGSGRNDYSDDDDDYNNDYDDDYNDDNQDYGGNDNYDDNQNYGGNDAQGYDVQEEPDNGNNAVDNGQDNGAEDNNRNVDDSNDDEAYANQNSDENDQGNVDDNRDNGDDSSGDNGDNGENAAAGKQDDNKTSGNKNNNKENSDKNNADKNGQDNEENVNQKDANKEDANQDSQNNDSGEEQNDEDNDNRDDVKKDTDNKKDKGNKKDKEEN